MARFDFVFSYWLFLWWVFYVLKVTPFNPSIFLILAAIINIGELLSGYVKNPRLFLTINFFIKVIPILSLMSVKISSRDIRAGIIYFAVYCIWMVANGQDVFKLRTPLTEFIKDKFS
jgi:hypothetical protein